METDGVMVLGTEAVEEKGGTTQEPAKNIVKAGDYIVGINDEAVTDKKTFRELLSPRKRRRLCCTFGGTKNTWT